MDNRWIRTALFGLRKIRNGLGGQDMPERGTIEFRGATVSDNPVDGTTVVEINADLGSATAAATPNAIAKRNALGNCAFVGLQSNTLGVTGATTVGGNLSTAGTLTATQTATFGAGITVTGGVSATSLLAGSSLLISGTNVSSSGTGLIFAAAGGATPMLVLNSLTSAGTLIGTMNATAYKITTAVTVTQYIDLIGQSNADWAYTIDTVPAYWKVSTTGATGLSTRIRFPISHLLPPGCTLTGAIISIAPDSTSHYPAGGSGGSANMPQIRLKRYTPGSNTEFQIAATIDSSANAAAYIVPHIIGISGQTHTVSKSTDQYFVEFLPESGVSSLPNTVIQYVSVSYTLPVGFTLLPN